MGKVLAFLLPVVLMAVGCGTSARVSAEDSDVNLGYSTVKQKDLTYSVSTVGVKENDAKMASERVRIQNMKMKELSEKGLDTSHIEKLSKQIADLMIAKKLPMVKDVKNKPDEEHPCRDSAL